MKAVVNGQTIPESAILFEFNRLVQFYSQHMSGEQIKAQLSALKRKAVEQAIGAKLLIQEADKLGIEASAEDVQARMDDMIKSAGGRAAFEDVLAKQNLSESMVRDSIAQGRKVDLLVEQLTRGVPSPTLEEQREHFRQHAAEYRRPARAQAQHILVKPDSDADVDHQVAKSKLEEIRCRIQDGADFGDEASAHSDCPSGKQAGGSLGWFSPGMMVKEFDNVVFDMSVGELSGIVETQFGYHLIHKLDEEKGGEVAFEDVQDKVFDFLRHARRGDVISSHIRDLRKNADIKIEEG